MLTEKQINARQFTPALAPWSDAGTATPKAALQTLAWAVTHNRIDLAQRLTEWSEAGLQYKTNQSDRLFDQKLGLKSFLGTAVNEMESFRIVSIQKTQQPDEFSVTFVKTFKNKRNLPISLTARLHKVGKEWHVVADIGYSENGSVGFMLPFGGSF